MNCEVSFSIREQVHIMDTTKPRFMTLSKCGCILDVCNALSQENRHGSWFLCKDEFVTKINGLGEMIPPKRDNDKNSDEDV